MPYQPLNLGTTPNDGTGDSLRDGGVKINNDFVELYGIKLESVVGGTNVTIDNTDPLNPIINADSGAVDSVNGQTGVVSLEALSIPYDNSVSLLTAIDVQGAIDELSEKISDISFDLNDYQLTSEKNQPDGYAGVGSDGKIPTSLIPNLAITDVIIAVETTIGDFATNNASYTFEQGDVIILDNGNGDFYMYKGGDKSMTANYAQISSTQVDWSQVINTPTTLSGYGITDAYTQAQADGLFVHLTGDETVNGIKTFSEGIFNGPSDPVKLVGSNTGTNNIIYLPFYESNGTVRQGYVGFPSINGHFIIRNDISNTNLEIREGGGINDLIYFQGSSSRIIWHSGNLTPDDYYLASNPAGYTTNTGTVTSATGGNGLTGSVTTSGALALGTPSTLDASTTNGVTSTSHTHAIDVGDISADFANQTQFRALQIVTINSATVNETDYRILFEGHAPNTLIEITLPAASTYPNREIVFALNAPLDIEYTRDVVVDGTTVTANTEIENVFSHVLVSDGTNWHFCNM